ncbi:hypothetical protein P4C99_01695 [Pontiellaceae bacterium B1224]|nr:hypothetical protein [Pontiellaceae bacterium B1224]
MKNRPAIIVLTLICTTLAILLFSANRKIATLKLELEASQKPLVAENEIASASSKITAEMELYPTIGGDSAEFEPTNEVNAALVQNTLKNQQRVMSSIANMRDNPTMNKIIEASQRGTIGALYADLAEYLKLEPEELNYFMDLLMFRQMENVDFGMKLMSGQLSAEERQQMADHLQEVNEEMKEQMKAFLNNPTDYAEFEYYEKTMNERMALSQLDQKLTAIEQPLSDESYRSLLDMMHSEREDFDWSTDLHDQEKNDISADRFSEENMQKHTDDISALNEQIFDAAMNMLTPEQFEAFKASLQATTDIQLAQFEMAGQLLRGQE